MLMMEPEIDEAREEPESETEMVFAAEVSVPRSEAVSEASEEEEVKTLTKQDTLSSVQSSTKTETAIAGAINGEEAESPKEDDFVPVLSSNANDTSRPNTPVAKKTQSILLSSKRSWDKPRGRVSFDLRPPLSTQERVEVRQSVDGCATVVETSTVVEKTPTESGEQANMESSSIEQSSTPVASDPVNELPTPEEPIVVYGKRVIPSPDSKPTEPEKASNTNKSFFARMFPSYMEDPIEEKKETVEQLDDTMQKLDVFEKQAVKAEKSPSIFGGSKGVAMKKTPVEQVVQAKSAKTESSSIEEEFNPVVVASKKECKEPIIVTGKRIVPEVKKNVAKPVAKSSGKKKTTLYARLFPSYMEDPKEDKEEIGAQLEGTMEKLDVFEKQAVKAEKSKSASRMSIGKRVNGLLDGGMRAVGKVGPYLDPIAWIKYANSPEVKRESALDARATVVAMRSVDYALFTMEKTAVCRTHQIAYQSKEAASKAVKSATDVSMKAAKSAKDVGMKAAKSAAIVSRESAVVATKYAKVSHDVATTAYKSTEKSMEEILSKMENDDKMTFASIENRFCGGFIPTASPDLSEAASSGRKQQKFDLGDYFADKIDESIVYLAKLQRDVQEFVGEDKTCGILPDEPESMETNDLKEKTTATPKIQEASSSDATTKPDEVPVGNRIKITKLPHRNGDDSSSVPSAISALYSLNMAI